MNEDASLSSSRGTRVEQILYLLTHQLLCIGGIPSQLRAETEREE